jgi:hypothetical protein
MSVEEKLAMVALKFQKKQSPTQNDSDMMSEPEIDSKISKEDDYERGRDDNLITGLLNTKNVKKQVPVETESYPLSPLGY